MLRGGRTLGLYVRQGSPLACARVMGGDARVGGFWFPPASTLYGRPPAQKDPLPEPALGSLSQAFAK